MTKQEVTTVLHTVKAIAEAEVRHYSVHHINDLLDLMVKDLNITGNTRGNLDEKVIGISDDVLARYRRNRVRKGRSL